MISVLNLKFIVLLEYTWICKNRDFWPAVLPKYSEFIKRKNMQKMAYWPKNEPLREGVISLGFCAENLFSWRRTKKTGLLPRYFNFYMEKWSWRNRDLGQSIAQNLLTEDRRVLEQVFVILRSILLHFVFVDTLERHTCAWHIYYIFSHTIVIIVLMLITRRAQRIWEPFP